MQTYFEKPPSSLPQDLNHFFNEIESQPEKEYSFWCGLMDDKYLSTRELKWLDFIVQRLTIYEGVNGCLSSIAVFIAIKNNKDINDLLVWLLNGSEDNSYAMTLIGYMYQEGISFPQDFQQAKFWYKKAIENENRIAMYNLGLMYEMGLCLKPDILEAASLYKKAMPYKPAEMNFHLLVANNPIILAQYLSNAALNKRANICLKNNDPETAQKLFEIGVDRECPEAMNNLGFMYQQGNGVLIDYPKAFSLHERAEKFNQPTSINNLGVLYYFGHGTEKNLDKAVHYFRKAWQLGCKEAEVSLGKMKERHPENVFVLYQCAMGLELWNKLKALHQTNPVQIEKFIFADSFLEDKEKELLIMELGNVENAVFYFRKLSLVDKEVKGFLAKMKARHPDNFFVQYHCVMALEGKDLADLHHKDPNMLFELLSEDNFLEEDAKVLLLDQLLEAQISVPSKPSFEICLDNNSFSFFPQEASEEEEFSEHVITNKFA